MKDILRYCQCAEVGSVFSTLTSQRNVSENTAEGRQGVYLAWQRWSYSEGEAVKGSGGSRVGLYRGVSIHLIDIREPEVLLQRQPEHRDKKAADGNSQHLEKSCKDAQSKHVGTTTQSLSLKLNHATV